MTDEPVSFEADIKPLFREGDRKAMEWAFDLWDYGAVAEHSTAILSRLEDGSMPCDRAWPTERIDLFRHWTETGKAA